MSPPRFDLIIANGTLVTTRGSRAADVAISAGRLAAIGAPGSLGSPAEQVDASGLLVLPGVIDGHVHFRQPGFVHEEDWLSGTRAAAMGGVTTVLEMPNTVPPTATVPAAQAKIALAEASAYCDFGIFGLLGDDPSAASELAGSGLVVGVKAFLGPTTGELPAPGDRTLRAALRSARDSGIRSDFHAEDAAMVEAATNRLRADGRRDALAHLEGRPPEAEVTAIDRVGRLLADTGAAGHIAHLTSAAGLARVLAWREHGAELTCEVTPHHCLLGRDAYRRFGGQAKVNPPIRGEPDAPALLAALAAGQIDCLASDHAPHLPAARARNDIWAVPAGFAGVETLLPLMLTEVAAGRLPLEALVRATSEGPARAWGLWPRKGSMELGADADLVLVDAAREGVVRSADLHGKNNESAWEGRPTVGSPVTTFVRGRIVMRDGELLGEPGWGRRVATAAKL